MGKQVSGVPTKSILTPGRTERRPKRSQPPEKGPQREEKGGEEF